MFLEKLELQGFKSFANKTILSFVTNPHKQPGITAIVGPNGSGKSNLAEAVRWVLGEQSIKMLRGKKSEDVIFAGSPKKARSGFAEVSICFNNLSKRIPLDFSEVVLTRRLYRDGATDYLINQQKARLQDINLLLAQANFGQRSYNVVGQGMIDTFLFLPPEERREFFEEAAGVKQYQIKKEEALRKLAGTEENLQQAEVLMREIEPRLRSLTRQVKRLERREEIEKELRNLQMQYYGGLWRETQQKIEQVRVKYQQAQAELETTNAALQKYQKQLEEIEKTLSQPRLLQNLQQEYEKLLAKRMSLREKEMMLKTETQTKKGKIDKKIPDDVKNELKDLSQAQERFLAALQQIKNLPEGVISEFAGLQQKLQKLLSSLEEEKTSASVAPSADILQKAMIENEEAIVALQKQLQQVSRNIDEERQQIFLLQRERQQQQALVNSAGEVVNNYKIELTRLETQQEDSAREIQGEMNVPPEDFEKIKVAFMAEAPAGAAKKEETKKYGLGARKETIAQQLNNEYCVTEIQHLKKQLELIGGIEQEAVQEYQETKERFEFLTNQSADLRQALKSLQAAIVDLEAIIQERFQNTFKAVNQEFDKFFKIIFNGGRAQLEIVPIAPEESESEIETSAVAGDAGKKQEETTKILSSAPDFEIKISATPPGKRLKNISMLSGGERALTSLALLCAVISCNPPPFVVLDEVDASLDELNTQRFAAILELLSKKTQFVIITHNRITMEKADLLYGVTMTDDGASRLLSIKLSDAEEVVANQRLI